MKKLLIIILFIVIVIGLLFTGLVFTKTDEKSKSEIVRSKFDNQTIVIEYLIETQKYKGDLSLIMQSASLASLCDPYYIKQFEKKIEAWQKASKQFNQDMEKESYPGYRIVAFKELVGYQVEIQTLFEQLTDMLKIEDLKQADTILTKLVEKETLFSALKEGLYCEVKTN